MNEVLRGCWCTNCRGRFVNGRTWRLHWESRERTPIRVANSIDHFLDHLTGYLTGYLAPHVIDATHIMRGAWRLVNSVLLVEWRTTRAARSGWSINSSARWSINAPARRSLEARERRLLLNADWLSGRGGRSIPVRWSLCLRGDLHAAGSVERD